MQLAEYENLQPHVNAYDLTWLTPNQHVAWRVESLMTKEPDTVAWINTMGENDVLYDVGANIGQYSLLAAKRGVRVHAFEPESQNFALLCRNIAINKLDALITPWPLALSDFIGLSDFHVTSLMAGGSCNAFDESVDFHLRNKQFAFTQGCAGTTLDEFTTTHATPTRIKIDVDGFEHKVLAGAGRTLQTTHSVLVETNTHLEAHRNIANTLRQFGLYPDEITANNARRTDGPFTGIGNVIYFRSKLDFLSESSKK